MRATRMILLAACLVPALMADHDFPVRFQGCSEYVGTGPVPLAQAAPMVPTRFTVPADGTGNATLVVRAARCSAVTVDNFNRQEQAIVSQIGIVIVPPDGTGSINNYTIAYATDSERLALRLRQAGLPVLYDSDLVYEVTPDPPVTASEFYAEVSPERGAGWTIHGTVTNNAFLTTPFVANWWFAGQAGVIKMSTDIPSITYKAAQSRLTTRRSSPLGQVLRANGYAAFGSRPTDFNIRGEFVSGVMTTTVRR